MWLEIFAIIRLVRVEALQKFLIDFIYWFLVELRVYEKKQEDYISGDIMRINKKSNCRKTQLIC